jgi:twinkle protein
MALKNFARRFDVLVIIVAHPTKSGAAKDPQDMTLYDISDSAAFQNKADFGVVVSRLGDVASENLTGISVRKVRYQPETGRLGSVDMSFDLRSKLFM